MNGHPHKNIKHGSRSLTSENDSKRRRRKAREPMEDRVQIREELRRSSERVGLNGDAGFSMTRFSHQLTERHTVKKPLETVSVNHAGNGRVLVRALPGFVEMVLDLARMFVCAFASLSVETGLIN